MLENGGDENQGVRVEGVEALATDVFTQAYWVNPAGPQGNAGLERLTSRGGDAFETAIGDRNAVGGGEPLTLSYYAGSWETTEVTLPEGEWSHVAWRQGESGELELFVNAELVYTGVGVPEGRIAADAHLNIGTRHNEVEGFEGLMDDFRHYDVALTEAEIQALLAPVPSLGQGPAEALRRAEEAPVDAAEGRRLARRGVDDVQHDRHGRGNLELEVRALVRDHLDAQGHQALPAGDGELHDVSSRWHQAEVEAPGLAPVPDPLHLSALQRVLELHLPVDLGAQAEARQPPLRGNHEVADELTHGHGGPLEAAQVDACALPRDEGHLGLGERARVAPPLTDLDRHPVAARSETRDQERLHPGRRKIGAGSPTSLSRDVEA